ncbi:hydrogenase nickel incorporation protein HypB [Candidatus Woesearchaeota archaeon]|nr:hydrogenase nickel incorporation protein HypB [Candidatus Woesearchaeota archaeon]
MCEECGCHDNRNKSEEIIINKSLTQENDRLAHMIWHDLDDDGICCINLLGAPGAGKTTVIREISKVLGVDKIAVIQGDLESDIDAKLLADIGIDSYQINTHSGCHLNAHMIMQAIKAMKQDQQLKGKDLLIIENVGNLVCPAGVKLGQSMDIVVSSTAEGHDKPAKYPIIFMNAVISIISKYDLAKYVDFDESSFLRDIRKVNPNIVVVRTSKDDPQSYEKLAKKIKEVRENRKHHNH